jgi:outer membrane receptor protein involved in Fe transport
MKQGNTPVAAARRQLASALKWTAVKVTAAATILCGAGALAQENGTVLEEVLVTARFREEIAQDIGQSIRAFSARDIERAGIVDFGDIARRTAGLDFQVRGPNANEVSIRGIAKLVNGSDLDILPSQPLVTQFVDEIPVTASSSRQRSFSTFDMERVEVLKGPQPTYFGEGSVGGSIRYFSAEPDLEDEGLHGRLNTDLSTTEDGGDNYTVNGAFAYTLIPGVLGFRVSGYTRDEDGFIDNTSTGRDDFNDLESQGGRLVIVAQPTDELRVGAFAHFADDDHGGDWLADSASSDPGFGQRPFDEKWRDDYELYSLNAAYEFRHMTLRSITGYYKRDIQYSRYDFVQARNSLPVLFGIDGDVTTATHSTDENFTQELRFVSSLDGPLNFIAGAFYKDNETTRSSISNSVQLVPLNAVGNSLLGITQEPSSLFFGTNAGLTTDREQLAIFAEGTWSVNQRLRLITGVRWVDEDLKTPVSDPALDNDPALATCILASDLTASPRYPDNPCIASIVVDNATILSFVGLEGLREVKSSVDGEWLPKFAAEYDLDVDVLLYASASKAIRNGGTNSTFVIATAPEIPSEDVEFDQDEMWGYELGVKSMLGDGDLMLNVAAFYNDWDHIQTLINTSAGSLFANAGSAFSYGFEVEATWRANDFLSFNGSYNYTRSEFDGEQVWETPESRVISELLGRPPNIIEDGNQLPNVPEHSLAVAADLVHPTRWQEVDFTVHADYQWIDERYQDSINSKAALLPDYGLMSMRIGLQTYNWSVVGYVRNLTNEISEQAVLQTGAGDNVSIYAYINQPRTYGLSLTYDF